MQSRLDSLKDMASRCANFSADLQKASSALDIVEADCQQLAISIGPTSDEAAHLVTLAEVL